MYLQIFYRLSRVMVMEASSPSIHEYLTRMRWWSVAVLGMDMRSNMYWNDAGDLIEIIHLTIFRIFLLTSFYVTYIHLNYQK